jgi:hypothetical protein
VDLLPQKDSGLGPAEIDILYAAWRQVDTLYEIWRAMHRRCENPRCRDYKWYGGRGIRVCPEWADFRTFLTDILTGIGPRPEGSYPSGAPRYSLDREDVNGDYGPGKVRWATAGVQIANRRPLAYRRVVRSGEKFGRLEVVREVDPIFSSNRSKQNGQTKHRAVLCRCSCGVEVTVKLSGLTSGASRSCGCLKREVSAEHMRRVRAAQLKAAK